MHRMKQLLITLLLTLGIGLSLAPAVYAEDPLADVCTGNNTTSATCQSKSPNSNPLIGANGILTKVATVIAVIAGVAAVIMIMISGFQMVTSSGDSQKVTNARKMLIGSLIGLVIIALAQAIILFVVGRL